jgi:hypothetical protein
MYNDNIFEVAPLLYFLAMLFFNADQGFAGMQ